MGEEKPIDVKSLPATRDQDVVHVDEGAEIHGKETISAAP